MKIGNKKSLVVVTGLFLLPDRLHVATRFDYTGVTVYIYPKTSRPSMCKYLYLAPFLVLFACSTKKASVQNPNLGFNGFPWGTPVDSIVYVVGTEPDERKIDRIHYNKSVYEGVHGDWVTYMTPGGRLKSGVFFKFNAKQTTFDTLQNKLTAKYGAATKNSEGALKWKIENTEITLYLNKGTLMAALNRVP